MPDATSTTPPPTNGNGNGNGRITNKWEAFVAGLKVLIGPFEKEGMRGLLLAVLVGLMAFQCWQAATSNRETATSAEQARIKVFEVSAILGENQNDRIRQEARTEQQMNLMREMIAQNGASIALDVDAGRRMALEGSRPAQETVALMKRATAVMEPIAKLREEQIRLLERLNETQGKVLDAILKRGLP